MTNTKFRKRALLSSVAMLLVALVALGSATFAWFTTNKNVTSNGFTGRAASAIGLKILSESDAGQNSKSVNTITDYKNSTTLFTNQQAKVLSPVSLTVDDTDGTFAGFTTSAASETDGSRDVTNAAVETVAAPTAYNNGTYYVEKVYVALAGNSGDTEVTAPIKFNNLSVTFSNDTIAGAARMIVLYHDGDGDTVVGRYAKSAETTAEITATAAAGTASTTEDVAYTVCSTPAASTTFDVSSTAGDCYFTVIVFLDGQDSQCTTANVVAADLVSNVVLNVGLAG